MDENDMEMEMGTPPSFTRSLEIELGDQVIAIDLDSLDQNTEDVIDVLQDAQCKVMVWTQLASEYWRRGWLESAQKITNAAVNCKFDIFRSPLSIQSPLWRRKIAVLFLNEGQSFELCANPIMFIVFKERRDQNSLIPVYLLLANIHIDS
jgi:hypothetical protein